MHLCQTCLQYSACICVSLYSIATNKLVVVFSLTSVLHPAQLVNDFEPQSILENVNLREDAFAFVIYFLPPARVVQ